MKMEMDMEDRVADAICEVVDSRLRWLRGKVAPDEAHPAEDAIDAMRDDLIIAVKRAMQP